MGLAVSIAVQALALLLFAMGVAAFVSLVKGWFVLRRIAMAGRQNYTAVLLKSPMVPPVSTIAVPPELTVTLELCDSTTNAIIDSVTGALVDPA